MAEQNDDAGEKEFEASETKRRHAREEGNVPQSRETNTLALIFGVLVAGYVLQSVVGGGVFSDFSSMLYHADSFSHDIFESNGEETRRALNTSFVRVLILLLILAAVVILSLVAQRAITFSAKKIQLDASKLSPVANLKKKYGTQGLTDFLKDAVKLSFASVIAFIYLVQLARDYYASTAIELGHFAEFTFEQVIKLVMWFFLFQFLLAAIDLPLQRQIHSNKLRMTREEMKKEMKQNEGDPHIKQQRRQKGQNIAKGQMMQNVKDATVVMVNPTHYAVALKWDPNSNMAPVCVAKGVDHLAARIREIAIENNVPIYSDPPTARSIYALVDVDEEIRSEHFAAVAAAINFVERVRKHM
ncbi:MAG: flagellar biosynthesis protein FlhB [Hyphomonas sp.]|nr:flagellar biosynthesis protein FlhB [Hyphomonas sp.]